MFTSVSNHTVKRVTKLALMKLIQAEHAPFLGSNKRPVLISAPWGHGVRRQSGKKIPLTVYFLFSVSSGLTNYFQQYYLLAVKQADFGVAFQILPLLVGGTFWASSSSFIQNNNNNNNRITTTTIIMPILQGCFGLRGVNIYKSSLPMSAAYQYSVST